MNRVCGWDMSTVMVMVKCLCDLYILKLIHFLPDLFFRIDKVPLSIINEVRNFSLEKTTVSVAHLSCRQIKLSLT